MTPALSDISTGDLAWWSGDRQAAHAAWTQALLEVGPGSEDIAATAMAHIRLLKMSGNIGPLIHEPPLQKALRDCPDTEAWCAIALADYHLWMPAFTGADPKRVPEILATCPLPGPVAARMALATGDLSLLEGRNLDGMGLGLQKYGRRPPDPGTWVLGVGLSATPGAGLGAQLRFEHPDLAWKEHHLSLQLGGDTRGGFVGAFRLILHEEKQKPMFYSSISHINADIYRPEAQPYQLSSLVVGGGDGWGGNWGISLGASTRWDSLNGDTWQFNPGPWLGLRGRITPDLNLSSSLESGLFSTFFLKTDTNLSWKPSLWGGSIAARLDFATASTQTPFYRLPTAGGANLLRGLPAGRYRDVFLGSTQLEYRHPLVGPLRGDLFVDTAWVEGAFHHTEGAGFALVLPPDDLNVTRLQFGMGEGQWGLILAWGEIF